MKLGVIPLCEQAYTTDPKWVAAFVRLLEDNGVESVWMPEHVIMAQDYEPLYEYSDDGRAPVAPTTMMPDPLHWLTFAAAHSEKLKLGTGVLIGPQHSAAILAKRLATVDALSSGRLEVGIGIGWQKEEYQAVGVPYSQRGKRLDEMLDAMRCLWLDDPATFHGEFTQFDKVFCDTKPSRAEGIPFLIGGSSEAAARRAGRRGDGYFPYTIGPEELALRMETVDRSAREAGRDPRSLSLTIWPHSYQPGGTFDLDLIRRYRDVGTDRLIVAAFEAGDMSLDNMKRFIGDYQDKIIGNL
ncbi:MAG: LLM class F420-dependent oxidoreductase [Halioglobus sp.]